MNANDFFAFCQTNHALQIEQAADSNIVIMPPSGPETSARRVRLCRYLGAWVEQNGLGIAFSSAGFILPNGATRSPDAPWVLRSRLSALAPEAKKRFLPLAPDFTIELRSPTDSLPALLAKMDEYRANGVRLGWLVAPIFQRVSIYTPENDAPVVLEKPDELHGGFILPGLVLPFARIWNPGF